MGFIEDMRWWHWIIISLLVGAALGFVNTQGRDVPAEHKSMDSMNFELNYLSSIPDARDPNKRIPWVSDITVYPLQEVQKRNTTYQEQLVIFTCITVVPDHPEKTGPQVFAMVAPCPYVPMPRTPASRDSKYPGTTVYIGKRGDTLDSVTAQMYGKATPEGRAAIVQANYEFREARAAVERTIRAGRAYFIPWNPAERHTISDFLSVAAAQGVPTSMRYAWWQSPRYAYVIWMSGSFVVVGVIWPMLVRVMVGGGMGRVREEEYDLTRFRGAGASTTVKHVKKEMSAEDLQQLNDLEASLKASLKEGDVAAQPAAVVIAPQVVKLKGASASELIAPVSAEEEKHYTGEYYPVVLPEVKTDEEDHGATGV